MDGRNNDKPADKGKKTPVPHIKISGAKNEGNSRPRTSLRSKETSGKSTLTVASSVRSKRDKDVMQDYKSEGKTAINAQDKPSNEKKDKRKEEPITGNVDNSAANSNGVNKVSSKGKQGNIPMRRCASIDVGELGRKKKGKRGKRQKNIDRETLLAIQTASRENVAQDPKQRSGSLGNRPNSLKLSSANNTANSVNANNVFPTPVPQKRHSNPISSERETSPNSIGANTSSDISPNDTSAILPPKVKNKRLKRPKPVDDNIELSDVEDTHFSSFPTGSGYRKHGRKYTFPSSPYHQISPPRVQKTWLRKIGFVVYMCFAFMVFCPVAALLLVLFPLCIFLKCFLNCCCTCCTVQTQACCACGQRLSVSERFWIQNELESPQIAQSLIIVEFGLSVPQIVNLVNTRLVLAKDENGNRLYPKFSQKVIPTCSDYVWQEDRSFFIHNHVFAMPKGIESLEDLQDYISELASRPLVFERPLWEVQVLTDFGDVRDTVILFRMHPCLADGVSMVKILYKSIADVDSVTTIPPALGKPGCLDSFRSVIDGPVNFVSKFLRQRSDFNLLHGQHIHLSGKKVVTWSEPFSLAYATKIKQVSKSTLNEVFMSVAAGSIRNYLILNGIPHPYDMQSSIPVYYGTNKHVNGVGNDVLLLKVNLPTNTEGAVPRLWQMKERMNKVRQSSLFAITRRLFKFSHIMLSESLWSKLWLYILRKCTCIVSSLPGPEISLRMSSKQIKTIFYWFPPVQQVALAISFFTYGDHIQMAVSTDRNVLPNPEIITKDFIFQVSCTTVAITIYICITILVLLGSVLHTELLSNQYGI